MGKIDCHLRPPREILIFTRVSLSVFLPVALPNGKKHCAQQQMLRVTTFLLRLKSQPQLDASDRRRASAAAGVILPLLSRSKDELSLSDAEDVKRAQKSTRHRKRNVLEDAAWNFTT